MYPGSPLTLSIIRRAHAAAYLFRRGCRSGRCCAEESDMASASGAGRESKLKLKRNADSVRAASQDERGLRELQDDSVPVLTALATERVEAPTPAAAAPTAADSLAAMLPGSAAGHASGRTAAGTESLAGASEQTGQDRVAGTLPQSAGKRGSRGKADKMDTIHSDQVGGPGLLLGGLGSLHPLGAELAKPACLQMEDSSDAGAPSSDNSSEFAPSESEEEEEEEEQSDSDFEASEDSEEQNKKKRKVSQFMPASRCCCSCTAYPPGLNSLVPAACAGASCQAAGQRQQAWQDIGRRSHVSCAQKGIGQRRRQALSCAGQEQRQDVAGLLRQALCSQGQGAVGSCSQRQGRATQGPLRHGQRLQGCSRRPFASCTPQELHCLQC